MGTRQVDKSRITDGRSQAPTGLVSPKSILCGAVADKSEIYSASPSHRRECTYYIAVGYYKLRNYSHARKFNGESSHF